MTGPSIPYVSTESPLHLPEHLERIAQRDYCAVNEGYWVLRDAATQLRQALVQRSESPSTNET